MRTTKIVCALGAMLAAAVPAFAVNIVQNGDFEIGVGAPNGGWTTFYGGSSLPGGWLVGGHSVDVHNNHTPAHSGTQSVDLSGEAAGSITQTLTTSIGAAYTLEFWVTPHSFGVYNKVFEVWWDGSLIDTITIPYSNTFPWSNYSYGVTATSASTLLSFVSLSPNGGAIIDDVSVSAVPDAGSVVGLFGLVSLLLLQVARRQAWQPV